MWPDWRAVRQQSSASQASCPRPYCSTATRLFAKAAQLYCFSSSPRATHQPPRSNLWEVCRPGGSSSRGHPGMSCDCIEQLLERVLEELHGVSQKLVRDFFHGDAGGFHVGERLVCAGEVLGEAVSQLAVIAEGIKRGRRNRVYSVRTDQFFDVKHVAVFRILGAGARP